MGKIIHITVDGTKTVKEQDETPDLRWLQAAVRTGYHDVLIEKVPYWDYYDQDENQKCIVWCSEYGKIGNLGHNKVASAEWHRDLKFVNIPPFDALHGDVVILIGDDKFLGISDE